jgi:hypothetical protein
MEGKLIKQYPNGTVIKGYIPLYRRDTHILKYIDTAVILMSKLYKVNLYDGLYCYDITVPDELYIADRCIISGEIGNIIVHICVDFKLGEILISAPSEAVADAIYTMVTEC